MVEMHVPERRRGSDTRQDVTQGKGAGVSAFWAGGEGQLWQEARKDPRNLYTTHPRVL